MLWKRHRGLASTPEATPSAPDLAAREGYPAAALFEAWQRLPLRHPRVLDFGPLQASLTARLEAAAGRLLVLDLPHELSTGTPPDLLLERSERLLDRYGPAGAPFDLVLVWHVFDYLPREALPRLGARLEPLLAPGAMLHAFLSSRPAVPVPPARLRVHETETGLELEWIAPPGQQRIAPARLSPGELERLLAGFVLERSIFLASGIHEVLFARGARTHPGRRIEARPLARPLGIQASRLPPRGRKPDPGDGQPGVE